LPLEIVLAVPSEHATNTCMAILMQSPSFITEMAEPGRSDGRRPGPEAIRPAVPIAGTDPPAVPKTGARLALWMVLIVALDGILWLSGLRTMSLSEAVEWGAARAESRAVGEVSDDQVRKTIRTQQETLRFWTTLSCIGDFVVAPLAPALRATTVAILLSALAALVGRPVHYGWALSECVAAQGIWVLGLAVRVVLAVGLRDIDVETSAVLALPPGTYPAVIWLALRQADAFTLWGWAAMSLGGWRRGQANLVVATLACLLVALSEAALRCGFALVVGAGMRLTLLPA
jgi:hypothetical protein